ncbi:uncharacterized protein LOC112682880 [Sipha flava]|uniref:Odorant receptor n=2 Tax=Sipha flava TaxID=143950 RepID=A0A8B8FFZ3_9HEMI|nr:uncharacterized protein LOC112682880 [Sipha flava]
MSAEDATAAGAGREAVDDDATVADLRLFRAIGLYQMLNPSDRRSGDRLRLAYRAGVALAFALQSVQIVGLFFTLNDLRRFAYMTVMVFNGLMCVLKGHVLVMKADQLWAVLDVARYRYTVCGARDPSALHRCRATLAVLLRTFAVLSFSTLIIWSTMPLFMDPYVPITKPDGTVGQYRTTIDNLWFPAMTESVYNYTPVWAFIYSMEVFICTFNVISWLLFDSCMVTMCFVLNAQFRTMAAGYESLGRHRDRRRIRLRAPSTSPGRIRPAENRDTELTFIDDLIIHINDNQNIINKFDDFFNIVQPVVLAQIATSSNSVVGLIFLIALLYVMGWSIVSAPIMKFMSGLASLLIELYIYCYAFNYIEIAKSQVNLGLYGSNWTVMDLKFKKTLLLAMNMNSSHNRMMKVSPTSIINLEMFSRVMNMSYSIVSILLNSSAPDT